MDPYSSGEETVIKTRKPYTITKQRERWTEEEHNRFLEALKIHGRAWQRIEEHIGTKTAVQIRSHAQKFFTKLEKEALVKGVPVRQALDIEIPPPRPKRKPSNPYPRKTSAGSSSLQLAATDGKPVTSFSSLHCVKDVLDLEKEPIPEKSGGEGKLENANMEQDEENCTEPFTFLQDASSASFSLTNKISTSKSAAAINLCTFREFVPVLVEVNNQDNTNESYITIEPRKYQKLDEHDKEQAFQDIAASNTLKFEKYHPLHGHLAQDQNPDKLTQPGNFGAFSIKDTQAAQNYPRHVPVHIVDGSLGSAQNFSSEISYQEQEDNQQMEKGLGQTKLVGNQPAFTTTEHYSNASRLTADQIIPTFHPLLTPVRGNQDNYASLFNDSTFSSFIVSALLQNPTALATARFAATYWPCANMEASSADSVTDGIPLGQLNSPAPSIAAIAATTVAAATAWWAAHGLLPSCPFPHGFTCPPATLTTPVDNSQPRAANTATPECVLQETNIAANNKVSLQQQSASKSLALASSKDSEGSRDMKLNTGSGAADAEQAAELALLDSSKAKNRKQVDRSSCGSNTGSSSDIDTDALEKNEKAKEELKEADASPLSDSSSCGSRSYISLNDSWKEVSEEGRLAFKALFSREVLPQSFSPPQDPTSEVQQKSNMEHGQQNLIQKNASASHLDLNRQLWTSQQPVEKGDQNQNGDEGMLSIGLGGQVKLKVHRTGFKPYKRCTVEAKESRMACTRGQNDEKGPKRMRLGGEAST